jgi:glycosyltransferase involved in cell wall biosynthesis
MIADMQRTRQLAWELPKLGWNVTVLSPAMQYQPPTCIDEDSAEFFPPGANVSLAPEFGRELFRIARIGNIGWRALWPMWVAGKRLLEQEHFDLVYFSTAHFALFALGRLWQRQFGVPYVLDLHDPIFKDDSRHPVWMRSRIKHRIGRVVSKLLEAHVMKAALGLVAVSPHYIDVLRRRYGAADPLWTRPGRAAVIPFSAMAGDLRLAAQGMKREARKSGPPYRILYVGVGGPVMMKSFKLFCKSLSQFRNRCPKQCEGIRIELFGTALGWKPGDPRTMADMAAEYGIGDIFSEEPGRVSYRRSVELLLQSDGALAFGVEDLGYMPSKLFSYALSGKPLLAVFHHEGPAYAQFHRLPNLGHALWFTEDSEIALEDAMTAVQAFVREVVARQSFDRRGDVAPFLAPAMACRHVELFEACVSAGIVSAT